MNILSRYAMHAAATMAAIAVVFLAACGGGSPSSPSPSPVASPTAPSGPVPAAVVIVKDVAATVEPTGTGVIYKTVLTVAETGGRSGATIASIRVNLSNSSRSGSATFDASDNIKTSLAAGGSNLYLLNVTSTNTDPYTSVTFTVTFADTAGVGGAYTSPAGATVTPVAAAVPSPPPPTSPPPAGAGKYDGTYDMFFRYPTSGSTSSSTTLRRFMIIRNSVVSSVDGLSAGTVDGFGRIRFTAPCTINSSGAVWTGMMNASALSGSNFGQGEYACNDRITGPQTWQATQSR